MELRFNWFSNGIADYLHQPRAKTRKLVGDPWSNRMAEVDTLSHLFHSFDGGAAQAETELSENM
ncbi:uncharacterized protein N7529_005365 [Penicillium soppii]|uniref:uncharacterized protein n=1 Tax=Penicillium soppii TaxID=69789 RepID=UPI0025482191|nr:uncharacterized protein N7529_005365 [Penicillium soppii]KAJ5873012.1 hypothetical protein N7529_005365 [Penicillium soppii]